MVHLPHAPNSAMSAGSETGVFTIPPIDRVVGRLEFRSPRPVRDFVVSPTRTGEHVDRQFVEISRGVIVRDCDYPAADTVRQRCSRFDNETVEREVVGSTVWPSKDGFEIL